MSTLTTPRLGPSDRGRRLTLEVFRDADEQPGYRYEPARGVLEATDVPNDPHELIVVSRHQEDLAYDLFEFWIVDPKERQVVVQMRQGDAWAEQVFKGEQAAIGRVLPGFSVRLPELWAAGTEPDPDHAAEAPGA